MLISFLALGPFSAGATTLDPVAVHRTLATADAVVDATVIGRTFWVGEYLPMTTFRLEVLDRLKGQTGRFLDLVVPGGPYEDGWVQVAGAPKIDLGDRILIAVSHVEADGDSAGSLAMMTTFSAAYAERRVTDSRALAYTSSGGVIRDYRNASPLLMDDASATVGEGLTWSELREQWMSRIESFESADFFRSGTPFTEAG